MLFNLIAFQIVDLKKDKEIWDKLQQLKAGKSKKEMKEMMEEVR